MNRYNYKLTLLKGVKYFVLFALPVLADKLLVSYPQIFQLSLGALLVMLVNWLKNYVGIRIV